MVTMYKNLIFIAAGGKGRRLRETIPYLRDNDLPKSLGIFIKGVPVLAYQLSNLIKVKDYQILLAFNDEKSIEVFKNFVRKGLIPKHNYLYFVDPYKTSNTMIDVLRGSKIQDVLHKGFETVITTSGDIYYNSEHVHEMVNLYKRFKCNVQTVRPLKKYMAMLKRHFHPIENSQGFLKKVKISTVIPKEIASHPQLLIASAFKTYLSVPKGTLESEFVIKALERGEKFRVIRPKQYVNVNLPRDYKMLKKIFNLYETS